jgi:Family of unknown function (DUF6448)
VDVVLPFVPDQSEAEVRKVFDNVVPVRQLNGNACEVADRLFFETVVRLHRAGEGAAYTGLKAAGLSTRPVIPLAERAVETGSAESVINFLVEVLRNQVEQRLARVGALAQATLGAGCPPLRGGQARLRGVLLITCFRRWIRRTEA